MDRLLHDLNRPLDAAALAAFRIVVGVLVFVGAARFLAYGWIDQFFVKPDFAFRYWGFEWVPVPGPTTIHALFWAMLALSAMVALGLLYRVAVVALFVIFTWVELIDVTYYLNHYYLVSLLLGLMCFLPLHRSHSLDARLFPQVASPTLPAYMTHLVRFQVGAVYFFAGVAKIGGDWLLHGQPLNIWLSSRTDTPGLGHLFDLWPVAVAMSWGGLINDLLMPFGLLNRRTRPYAYAVVVVFHALTGYLFNIGMFPLIMVSAALIFFSPSWPRRFFPADHPHRQPPVAPDVGPPPPARRVWMALAVAWIGVQALMPWRFLLYPGDVLWHEQGMRWAWRVMLREKNGSVTYHVTLPDEGRRFFVPPGRYLSDYQEREMSGQPDLILQLGQHIGRELQAQGHPRVEVRVEALVSLNGRRPAPLIDPQVDLMTLRDGIWPADWILPAPQGPPIHLKPAR